MKITLAEKFLAETSMTLKELEIKIKEYKDEIKKTGIERPLTDAEISAIGDSLDIMPREYWDAIHLSQQNEHGTFEQLPSLIRNYIGALALRQFREKFGEMPSLDNEEVRQLYLRSSGHLRQEPGTDFPVICFFPSEGGFCP